MRPRADFLIAFSLAALTLTICLFFAPRGFQVGFVDMGHDGYQLRQVLDLTQGGVVFKDTFDQYGPLNGYLNAVGFITLGHRLLAMKYFLGIWYAVIAAALYVIARQWLEPALAAFSALVWLVLAPFYNHGIMISPHAYALLFQALATVIVLRSKNLAPSRFAVVGLLAGLCWAVKQSMGVLYLASIVAYLLLLLVVARAGWRRVAAAIAASGSAFVAVIGLFLALLWMRGALGDWYLQTIVFPSQFYLANAANPITTFVWLQFRQPLYWMVIRLVVLIGALVQIVQRRPADDLVLIGSITAFLWLAAYPSGNFMHQWWTASLTIPAFVVCVRNGVASKVNGERLASCAAVALVSVVVGTGVVERVNASRFIANTLTETISEPAVLRGIRTDAPTRRAFETLYKLMARYRSDHPGTKVVSIESADGWSGGIVESLPFISFFDDNPHAQPVYWSLPVLSTTVYPRYAEVLWRQVREERPLLVEHRNGKYKPLRIAGYALLVAAQSDFGHWYVYAPHAADPAADDSIYLAADGSMERGVPEDEDDVPELTRRLSTNIEGAWRGRVLPTEAGTEIIELPGEDPLNLVDPTLVKGGGLVNIYTWPANLPEANFAGPIEPVPTDVVWRDGPGDIVRDFRAGAWRVQGYTRLRFGYLLQWREKPVDSGARFVVRGELFEGGVQVGLLEHGEWAASVCVTRPGRFQVVLQTQTQGQYAVVAANCIWTSWAERAQLYPIRATFGLLVGGGYRNFLQVSQAGWIPPPAMTPAGH